jgi:hypothetical protein
VTRHQELCPQQGTVRSPKDQNVARHSLSFTHDLGAQTMPPGVPTKPGSKRLQESATDAAAAGPGLAPPPHQVSGMPTMDARVYPQLIGVTIRWSARRRMLSCPSLPTAHGERQRSFDDRARRSLFAMVSPA